MDRDALEHVPVCIQNTSGILCVLVGMKEVWVPCVHGL